MIKNSNGYNLHFPMFLKCFYQDYVVNRQAEIYREGCCPTVNIKEESDPPPGKAEA